MTEPIRHLYFHIPFCPKLCPYCSFHVEVGSKYKNRAFLDALLHEVDAAGRRWELKPRTIYFGGGTPSALTTEQLSYLFEGLRARLDLSDLEEWDCRSTQTLERHRMGRRARFARNGEAQTVNLPGHEWPSSLQMPPRGVEREHGRGRYGLRQVTPRR